MSYLYLGISSSFLSALILCTRSDCSLSYGERMTYSTTLFRAWNKKNAFMDFPAPQTSKVKFGRRHGALFLLLLFQTMPWSSLLIEKSSLVCDEKSQHKNCLCKSLEFSLTTQEQWLCSLSLRQIWYSNATQWVPVFPNIVSSAAIVLCCTDTSCTPQFLLLFFPPEPLI